MTHTAFIKDLQVGPYSLRLLIQDEIPLVEWENHHFNHIWVLIQKLPLLSNISFIREFAEISNFLWKGMQFQFIDNIEDYKTFYLNQVDLELKHPSDVFRFRLTDYKIFDVNVMEEPKVVDNMLSYFVYQTSTALPFQVVCPFPYDSPSTFVHYKILPLKNKAIL